jgi:hypothetical protein
MGGRSNSGYADSNNKRNTVRLRVGKAAMH